MIRKCRRQCLLLWMSGRAKANGRLAVDNKSAPSHSHRDPLNRTAARIATPPTIDKSHRASATAPPSHARAHAHTFHVP